MQSDITSDKAVLPSTLFKFIISFIKPYKWGIYGWAFFGCLSGIYGTVNAYLTKTLIDTASQVGINEATLLKVTLVPALLLVINYEMQNISWRVNDYINLKISPKIKNQIIQDMFAYVQKHSFKFFQDSFSGTITNNITKMAEGVETILFPMSVLLLRGTIQLSLALITMYFVHPVFFITLFVWAVLFLTISIRYSNKVKVLSHAVARAQSIVSGKIIDSVSNVTNVRLFSREMFEIQYLKKYLQEMAHKFQNKEWFFLKLHWAQGITIMLLIAVTVFSLIWLRKYNLVTLGDFAFILGSVLYLADNLWWLTEQIDKLNDTVGQCNQSLTMIVVPHGINDVPNAKSLLVSRGDIAFRDVTFNYRKESTLFSNKSVNIPGGQKVGLVGFSGSGKTTFVNLIVRLFDLSSGAISIDGQNIAEVTQSSLRENIGFIPQDPLLFHRSLMENIRYGKVDASDEEVILAAKKAHAHEFIILTQEGYQSLVGERGIKLSGGQKQRISVARAILKNAPILILDEATSALDSVTEGYIQESLKTLMQGKTVVVIAHRLSTLLNLDRILVFDQGKIVEDGTHQALLAKDGMYATLWNSQVGGFLLDDAGAIESDNEQVII